MKKIHKLKTNYPTMISAQFPSRVTNIKISTLPLRPSTISLLSRRGFFTVADIRRSKGTDIASKAKNSEAIGSIGNLADELGVSPSEAARVSREVCKIISKVS